MTTICTVVVVIFIVVVVVTKSYYYYYYYRHVPTQIIHIECIERIPTRERATFVGVCVCVCVCVIVFVSVLTLCCIQNLLRLQHYTPFLCKELTINDISI